MTFVPAANVANPMNAKQAEILSFTTLLFFIKILLGSEFKPLDKIIPTQMGTKVYIDIGTNQDIIKRMCTLNYGADTVFRVRPIFFTLDSHKGTTKVLSENTRISLVLYNVHHLDKTFQLKRVWY